MLQSNSPHGLLSINNLIHLIILLCHKCLWSNWHIEDTRLRAEKHTSDELRAATAYKIFTFYKRAEQEVSCFHLYIISNKVEMDKY